jgi:hypothetical protein
MLRKHRDGDSATAASVVSTRKTKEAHDGIVEVTEAMYLIRDRDDISDTVHDLRRRLEAKILVP